MKNLKYIFGKWHISDYIFIILSVIAVLVFSILLKLSPLPSIMGVMLVLATILVFKDNVLGYVFAILTLSFFCYFLYIKGLTGNVLLIAGLMLPLLVYKIFVLFFSKLQTKEKLNKIDYIIMPILILLAGYPFYLLMISMNSFMPILETICLLIMLVMLFLQIRSYNFSKYLFIIITALQIVLLLMTVKKFEFANLLFVFCLAISMFVQIKYALGDLKRILIK